MAKKIDEIDFSKCEEIVVNLNFFTVRSKDGKFLRAKKHGYGSFDTGKSWTDNIAEAKIYSKPGPARSQCTWWSTNYPKFGSPDLVLITTGKCLIVNEDDRILKKKIAAEKIKLEKEVRQWTYLVESHAAKIKLHRGDGGDSETIRLRNNLKSATDRLAHFKTQHNMKK